MAANRESSREALLRRIRDGESRQAAGRSGFFKQGVEGLKLWTPDSKNSNIIDLVPYEAGNNDPYLEPGDLTYLFEFFVHSNVGMSGEGSIMCLAETYPQGSRQGPCKCPICQDRIKKMREGAPENIIKQLRPKRYPRTVYNIVCWNNREQENKGIQIFHTSFYLLEMYLREMAKKTNRTGSRQAVETLIPFMDLDEGKSIAFKKEGEKDTVKFVGTRFEDRDGYNLGDYLDEMKLKPFCLDEIIVIPTYEDVEQYYYGDDTANQPTGEQASRRGRGRTEEPEDDPPARGRGRGTEEEASSRGRGRNAEEESSRGKRRDPEPEPEKEEPRRRARNEEPEDDPPPRRRREADPEPEKKRDAGDCPNGFEFGKDVDTKDECEKCGKWEACAKKGNELNKKSRKDPEPPDDPPPRRGKREEPEDDPPPSRRARNEEPEDDPPPRRRARSEEPPEDDPPPRRRRRSSEDD